MKTNQMKPALKKILESNDPETLKKFIMKQNKALCLATRYIAELKDNQEIQTAFDTLEMSKGGNC